MTHYVYKITDPITGQFYYGSRSNEDPENDSYMGSMSTWTPEDKSRLVKEIIKDDFTTREDAIEFEDKIIGDYIEDNLNENYCRPHKGFHNHKKCWMCHPDTTDNILIHKREVGKYEELGYIRGRINVHSDEVKQKLSKNHADVSGKNNPMYGKTHSDEVKQILSECNKGKKRAPFSNEHKRKISEARKGITFSKKHKQNISKSKKGKPAPNQKMVSQYNADGTFVQNWNSLKDAAESVNGFIGNISRCCRGKSKTHKGFIWTYKYNEL